MNKEARAYISTHSPSRFDDVPPAQYKPIADRFAFGIRVRIGNTTTEIASSWIKTKEVTLSQITAVSYVLGFLEELDEEFDLELLLRTAYLHRRIGMVEDRLLKQQAGLPVRRKLKNEEVWVDTTRRLQRIKYGIRPVLGDVEVSELVSIEQSLKDDFYLSKRFCLQAPLEAKFVSLRD
jgi:hypothetical protein